MSEYQYIYFSAVDKQLDDKQLAYMRRQSSRAEVTPPPFALNASPKSANNRRLQLGRLPKGLELVKS